MNYIAEKDGKIVNLWAPDLSKFTDWVILQDSVYHDGEIVSVDHLNLVSGVYEKDIEKINEHKANKNQKRIDGLIALDDKARKTQQLRDHLSNFESYSAAEKWALVKKIIEVL